MSSVQIAVLGPLEVRRDGAVVPLAGPRLRALLCRLAVETGRSVSVEELLDAIWEDDPPADPANALQSLVSRLRRALGSAEVVRQDGAGYRLLLDGEQLDLTVVTDRTRRAEQRTRAGDLEGADEDLAEALALFRGDPLVDAGGATWAGGYAAHWRAQRRAVVTARASLTLRLGRADAVGAELDDLIRAAPLDEPLVALRMRTLVAAGRPADALGRYEQVRRRLRDELGTTPGAELQQLHLMLVRADGSRPDVSGTPAGGPDRSNLRVRYTSFVGREAELEQVLEGVRSARLTTVVGPGGAGKTRLAVEVAGRWLAAGGDSAWLVELAPVSDGDNIAAAVLGALGLREARMLDHRGERTSQDARERLLGVLRGSDCLLVVDNCEHLIEPVAVLVDQILAEAPGVRVLATSREPLALTGEVLTALPPLGLPPPEVTTVTAAGYPAVQLWLDRARAARPGFALDETTLEPVVEIVGRLDGLPLAIELAAARLRVLPVAEIAARLSDRFRLLTGGNRASLPRHRTLRAVVAWSWDLLRPEERLLADRLAVFPAGADAAAVRAVCGGGGLPEDGLDDLLLSLVEKSLLQAVEGPDPADAVRFQMLETIREYGVEQLAERGELEQARMAHATYYADLAVALEPALRSRAQLSALATLNAEHENVLAALRFLGDSGQGSRALHLALALVWYWSLLDAASEAMTWLKFVLAVNAGSADPDLVFARSCLVLVEMTSTLSAEGSLMPEGTTWEEAQLAMHATAEELAGAGTPPFPGIEALRPMLAVFAGRPDLAEVLIRRSLATADPWLRAALQSSIASYAENEGDVELMRTSTEEAYAAFTQLGDRWGLAATLTARARLLTLEGRTREAVADYEEAAGHVVALGSAEDDLYIRLRLADLYQRLGDLDRARAQLESVRHPGRLRSGNRERDLFAGAALAGLEWRAGETGAALARIDALRGQLQQGQRPAPLLGHLTAIVLSTAGAISAASGELEQAAADLQDAYRAGLGTGDMPIMASVGTAVTRLALACGRDADAATILGASARLLGAVDASDTEVAELTERARSVLGEDDFDALYAAGRELSREDALARLDPAPLTSGAGAQARLR